MKIQQVYVQVGHLNAKPTAWVQPKPQQMKTNNKEPLISFNTVPLATGFRGKWVIGIYWNCSGGNIDFHNLKLSAAEGLILPLIVWKKETAFICCLQDSKMHFKAGTRCIGFSQYFILLCLTADASSKVCTYVCLPFYTVGDGRLAKRHSFNCLYIIPTSYWPVTSAEVFILDRCWCFILKPLSGSDLHIQANS